MSDKTLWMLPDGINELIRAAPLEFLRRKILDLFAVHGFELVAPPMLEFLDSLLVGSGNELEFDTIKITDQISGKLLGLRADITPQIARIAAKCEAPRLCYVGEIAKARDTYQNRIQMQIGAELFGYTSIESDIEIIQLMIEALKTAHIEDICLDIGHVGVFRSLVDEAKFSKTQEHKLVDSLQRKSKIDTSRLLNEFDTSKSIADMILALIDLHGGKEVLDNADELLDSKIVGDALLDLKALASCHPSVHFDLSELRGYSYHTGLIFAAFVKQSGAAIAKGGRYDEVCSHFGKARSATGFGADLFDLLDLFAQSDYTDETKAIFAPKLNDKTLFKRVADLRQAGNAVVVGLPEDNHNKPYLHCTHQLVQIDGIWQVHNINQKSR